VSNALTSSLDVLPTLASLAQVNLPGDRYFDGEDISSLITGTARTVRQVRAIEYIRPCPETALCCLKLFASMDLKAVHIIFGSYSHYSCVQKTQ
jgi:hypothetical protein